MPNAAQATIIFSSGQLSANVVLTGNIKDGELLNADINAAAAIAYTKLALTGTILNADINAAAAIAYSKLALTGAILNADLAGAIDDTKLNTISTAGKVSGAAITLLTSLPSGAGVIPAANLPAGMSLLGSTILSGTATSISVASFPAATHLRVVIRIKGKSGSDTDAIRFNSDSAGNYADGTAPAFSAGGDTSATKILVNFLSANDGAFIVLNIYNYSTLDKVVRGYGMTFRNDENVTTAPAFTDQGGIWKNTADQITTILLFTVGGSVTYGIGSSVEVYGYN